MIETVGTPLLWIGFTTFVLAMLALDLGVFHRTSHVVRFREAATWSVVWISLALAFNVLVYHWFGREKALEFLTGYLIEEMLSVDNVFVFLVLFGCFAVPRALQHRVLFWGVLGALVMRAAFIVLGVALLSRFHWIIYVFGALLLFTAVKLLRQHELEVHPERNPVYRLFRRFVPAVNHYSGDRFVVVENGRRYATPLLFVLVVVEATDLVFAVDSIPAIFAITRDPFIVYTSNIFAILGLRSLFFVLAGVMLRFVYLQTGLALVLGFVGLKMLLADVYTVPIATSLAVVASLIGGSIAASLWRAGGPHTRAKAEPGSASPGLAADCTDRPTVS
jgi:tellurite resistance protein TerC